MLHRIEYDPQAADDLRAMRAFERAAVLDTIDRLLSVDPTRISQSRIKRLRGLDSPQYRLRVGNSRVFYDVLSDGVVYVLRITPKEDAEDYLKEQGHEN